MVVARQWYGNRLAHIHTRGEGQAVGVKFVVSWVIEFRLLSCSELLRWEWGWKRQLGANGRRVWGKRTTTKGAVRFRDILVGPPTSWVPPWCFSPPQIPSSSDKEPPTSLWKGEGQLRQVVVVVELRRCGIPTLLGAN